MNSAKERKRLWGGAGWTIVVMVGLGIGAGVASAFADPERLPTSISLDSGWIFHALFGIVAFLILYVIAALATYTVASGSPLTKLGFWKFSFEGPAAEALAEGAASLQGIDQELEGLNQRIDTLIAISIEGERAVAALAHSASAGETVAAANTDRIHRLEALSHTDDERRRATTDAVRRFDDKFSELERLFEESEARRG